LARNGEEHTIIQSLIGRDRVRDWKALEAFAKYGYWNLRLLQGRPPGPWTRLPDGGGVVREHNGVVLGAVLANPGQPAWFLPVAGRLYFRKTQPPPTGEVFRTKCELLVERGQQQAQAVNGPHWLVFDGGFAQSADQGRMSVAAGSWT
jgi:hypothetical protein